MKIVCIVDSNPPGKVLWKKKGLSGIFNHHPDIDFSPVTRENAGVYTCTGENALGTSEPAEVELDVKCKLIQYVYLNYFFLGKFQR